MRKKARLNDALRYPLKRRQNGAFKAGRGFFPALPANARGGHVDLAFKLWRH